MTSERNPERGFLNQKEKNEKWVLTETEYMTTENVETVSSIRQWKKAPTLIVDDLMLRAIEEKRISGNRSVKVHIFPEAITHDMYDYLKPFLKKNPDNINISKYFEWHKFIKIILNEKLEKILNLNIQSYCIKY